MATTANGNSTIGAAALLSECTRRSGASILANFGLWVGVPAQVTVSLLPTGNPTEARESPGTADRKQSKG